MGVAGNWTNNGSFISGTDTVTFDGNSQITTGGTGDAQDFNNVVVAASVALVASAIDIGGTLTINAGKTLDLSGNSLTASILSNDGTIKLANSETLNITSMDYDSGEFEYCMDNTYGSLRLPNSGAGYHYHDLTISGTNSHFDMPAELDIDGVLKISSGATVDANGKTVYVAGGITVADGGSFIHGENIVILDTADPATMTGSMTFYDLKCQVPGKNISFEKGKTYTIENIVTLQGGANNITLQGTGAGDYWHIDLQPVRSNVVIDHVTVKDSYNDLMVAGNHLYIDPPDSTDGGNNRYWFTPTDTIPTEWPGGTTKTIPEIRMPEIKFRFNWGAEIGMDDESSSSDKKKYKKGYAPGKYKTVVVVFEGKVLVASYSNKGIDYKNATAVTSGQRAVQKGRVMSEVSVLEGKVLVSQVSNGNKAADYKTATAVTGGQKVVQKAQVL
jgi:hypothetical protein